MPWNCSPINITKESIFDLFDNKYPALHIEQFLNDDECDKISKTALDFGLKHYDYNFDIHQAPPAQHLFDQHYLYEHKTPDEFIPQAKKANADYARFCDISGIDGVRRVQDLFEDILGKRPEIATQEGHMYTFALVRELTSSALLHADFAQFIPTYWSISDTVAQFAWNIYLTDPHQGGTSRIYNKFWQRDDDQHIIGDTYGYDHCVVDGVECYEIQPKKGLLAIFNSRNFHEVDASTNLRLTLGGHMGLKPSGDIVMWV